MHGRRCGWFSFHPVSGVHTVEEQLGTWPTDLQTDSAEVLYRSRAGRRKRKKLVTANAANPTNAWQLVPDNQEPTATTNAANLQLYTTNSLQLVSDNQEPTATTNAANLQLQLIPDNWHRTTRNQQPQPTQQIFNYNQCLTTGIGQTGTNIHNTRNQQPQPTQQIFNYNQCLTTSTGLPGTTNNHWQRQHSTTVDQQWQQLLTSESHEPTSAKNYFHPIIFLWKIIVKVDTSLHGQKLEFDIEHHARIHHVSVPLRATEFRIWILLFSLVTFKLSKRFVSSFLKMSRLWITDDIIDYNLNNDKPTWSFSIENRWPIMSIDKSLSNSSNISRFCRPLVRVGDHRSDMLALSKRACRYLYRLKFICSKPYMARWGQER